MKGVLSAQLLSCFFLISLLIKQLNSHLFLRPFLTEVYWTSCSLVTQDAINFRIAAGLKTHPSLLPSFFFCRKFYLQWPEWISLLEAMLILYSVDNFSVCMPVFVPSHACWIKKSPLLCLWFFSNHSWERDRKDFYIKVQLLPFDVMAQIKKLEYSWVTIDTIGKTSSLLCCL